MITAERLTLEMKKALSESKPSLFFETLREMNVLDVLFPEINNMIGMEQNAIYHPEGDVFIHTMLVLDEARSMTNKFDICFAALTHDLGKALPEYKDVGHFIAHESKGVPLVEVMCDRLKIGGNTKKLAVMVAKYHLKFHKIDEMKPSTIVRFFNDTGAFRNGEMFHDFMIACVADENGRHPKPKIDGNAKINRILEMVKICKDVPVQPILDKGFVGLSISIELDKRRADALRKLASK
jgi:tRNA nucleotidyltransferase (CCA-adding enzyme)